jgi:TP901 family phage tail tape measure protein
MAVLNANKEVATELAETNRDLAKSYGGTISEIDELTLTLGRAGVATEDLASASKASVELSRITGDSFGDASKVMSTFIIAYKDAGVSVEDLSSKLAYMANASKMSVEDLGTLSNYALSTASSLNMSADSVGALATTFSNLGMNASTIGTQIRKLDVIFKSSKGNVKDFWDIAGQSQDEFLKKVKNGDEGIIEFTNLLATMSEKQFTDATRNMEILEKQLLQNIRNGGDKIIEHFKMIKTNLDASTQAQIKSLGATTLMERAWNSVTVAADGAVSSILNFAGREEIEELSSQYSELQGELVKLKEGTDEYNEVSQQLNSTFVSLKTKLNDIDNSFDNLADTLYKNLVPMGILEDILRRTFGKYSLNIDIESIDDVTLAIADIQNKISGQDDTFLNKIFGSDKKVENLRIELNKLLAIKEQLEDEKFLEDEHKKNLKQLGTTAKAIKNLEERNKLELDSYNHQLKISKLTDKILGNENTALENYHKKRDSLLEVFKLTTATYDTEDKLKAERQLELDLISAYIDYQKEEESNNKKAIADAEKKLKEQNKLLAIQYEQKLLDEALSDGAISESEEIENQIELESYKLSLMTKEQDIAEQILKITKLIGKEESKLKFNFGKDISISNYDDLVAIVEGLRETFKDQPKELKNIDKWYFKTLADINSELMYDWNASNEKLVSDFRVAITDTFRTSIKDQLKSALSGQGFNTGSILSAVGDKALGTITDGITDSIIGGLDSSNLFNALASGSLVDLTNALTQVGSMGLGALTSPLSSGAWYLSNALGGYGSSALATQLGSFGYGASTYGSLGLQGASAGYVGGSLLAGGGLGYGIGSLANMLGGVDTRADVGGGLGGLAGAALVGGLPAVLIGSILGTGIGGLFGGSTRLMSTGADIGATATLENFEDITRIFEDYKKSKLFSSKSWTSYKEITDDVSDFLRSMFVSVNSISDVFNMQDLQLGAGRLQFNQLDTLIPQYLISQIMGFDIGKTLEQSDFEKFNPQTFMTQSDDSWKFTTTQLTEYEVAHNAMVDQIGVFLKDWEEVAKEMDSTVLEVMSESLGAFQSTIREFALYNTESDIDKLKLTSDYAQQDLATLARQVGVDVATLTVQNFEEQYREALSEDFTKKTIDQWEALGDALLDADSKLKAYTQTVEGQAQALINTQNALINESNSRIQQFIDSYKTEYDLMYELSLRLGVGIAQTNEELKSIFDTFKNSDGLLTEFELTFLNANKAYIESLKSQAEALRSQAEVIERNAQLLRDQFNLIGVTGSEAIEAAIDGIEAKISRITNDDYIVSGGTESYIERRLKTNRELFDESYEYIRDSLGVEFTREAIEETWNNIGSQIALSGIDFLNAFEEQTVGSGVDLSTFIDPYEESIVDGIEATTARVFAGISTYQEAYDKLDDLVSQGYVQGDELYDTAYELTQSFINLAQEEENLRNATENVQQQLYYLADSFYIFTTDAERLQTSLDLLGLDELPSDMDSFEQAIESLRDMSSESSDEINQYSEAINNVSQEISNSISEMEDELQSSADNLLKIAEQYGSISESIYDIIGNINGDNVQWSQIETLLSSITSPEDAQEAVDLINTFYSQQENLLKMQEESSKESLSNQISLLEAEEDILRSFKDFVDDMRINSLEENFKAGALLNKYNQSFSDLNTAIQSGDEDVGELGDRTLNYASSFLDAYKSVAVNNADYMFEQSKILNQLESYSGTGQTATIDDVKQELEDLNNTNQDIEDLSDLQVSTIEILRTQTIGALNTLDGSIGLNLQGINSDINDLQQTAIDYLGLDSPIVEAINGIAGNIAEIISGQNSRVIDSVGNGNTSSPINIVTPVTPTEPANRWDTTGFNSSQLAAWNSINSSRLNVTDEYLDRIYSFINPFEFADGGIVTAPTLGMIRESGYDEAVIPLKNPNDPLSMNGVMNELRELRNEVSRFRESNDYYLRYIKDNTRESRIA